MVGEIRVKKRRKKKEISVLKEKCRSTQLNSIPIDLRVGVIEKVVLHPQGGEK